MTGMTQTAARPGERSPRPRRQGRLRSQADIKAVFDRGRAFHSRTLSVYCLSSDTPTTRTAVVAGRKVGGAVQRNLAKRRMRAALQQLPLPEGVDMVVVARHHVLSVPFSDLETAMAEQVRRCSRACRS